MLHGGCWGYWLPAAFGGWDSASVSSRRYRHGLWAGLAAGLCGAWSGSRGRHGECSGAGRWPRWARLSRVRVYVEVRTHVAMSAKLTVVKLREELCRHAERGLLTRRLCACAAA